LGTAGESVFDAVCHHLLHEQLRQIGTTPENHPRAAGSDQTPRNSSPTPPVRGTSPSEHAAGVCRSSLARNAAAASLAVPHGAVHNWNMVALRTIEPHRATVADAAGSECSARLTWHPDAERFTLTHWAGLICVAQIEVSPEDASELLAVLAEGVAETMPRWLAADDLLPT